MLRLLMCLFGFHGAVEITDGKDECRDCLKEIKQFLHLPNVLRHIKPCRILDVDGVFFSYLVVLMDKVDARRNKERYEQNIRGASLIHPCDMPQPLVDALALFMRDQRRKIQNIEECMKQ